MRFPRASGIFLHITSLPSQFGIGDLGPTALEFVDFLAASGQGVWQILPLSPPAQGNSPYSCYSAFAGNPLLISPEELVNAGFLSDLDLANNRATVSALSTFGTHVDYPAATAYKEAVLRQAFVRSRKNLDTNDAFASYSLKNSWWLDEFARFEALMWHFGQSNWTRWPQELATRDPDSLKRWDNELASDIEYSKFLQFVFDSQWSRVKGYANGLGIRMYGDMPFFVAHESADVWANQSLFCLDKEGSPALVAGVPPDYFSEDGQLWGNPLYRWDVMEARNFAWWTKRFRRSFEQFDLLRVDHFRGFESYWQIPAGAASAREGEWQKGPGESPFAAARDVLGELPIIAEDLGMITRAVHDLQERLGFPPMRVLQFGFEDADDDFHRPDQYPEHCFAYTGTHDNETVMGWYRNRQEHGTSEIVDEYLTGENDIHWQLVQLVLNSAADTAIVPLQDVLGLGNDARMNTPGEADGNWAWRLGPGDLTDGLANRLRKATETANRCSAGS